MENKTKLATAFGTLLAVVAVFMIFAPAITMDLGAVSDSLNGVKTAFGYSYAGVKLFGASANIATYALLIVGIINAARLLLGNGDKNARIFTAICFLVAGIFFFCTLEFCNFYPDMQGAERDIAKAAYKSLFKLGIGSIIGGILSIIAALVIAAPMFMKNDTQNTTNTDSTAS